MTGWMVVTAPRPERVVSDKGYSHPIHAAIDWCSSGTARAPLVCAAITACDVQDGRTAPGFRPGDLCAEQCGGAAHQSARSVVRAGHPLREARSQ